MARQGLQPTRGSTCRFSTASPDHQEPSTGRHMFAPDLDDISICKGQEPAGTISAHLPHRRPPFDSHGLDCQSSANSSRCSGPGDTIPGRNPFPEVIDPMIEPVKRLHQTRPLSGNAPDLAQKAKLRHANSPQEGKQGMPGAEALHNRGSIERLDENRQRTQMLAKVYRHKKLAAALLRPAIG